MNKIQKVIEIPEIFKDFNEWAKAEGKIIYNILHKDFCEEEGFRYSVVVNRKYKTVNIVDMKYNGHGSSKCLEDDEFRTNIGITIAYYKMMKWELPKKVVYKKLSEMEQGDIFSGVLGRYKFICYNKTDNSFVVKRYMGKREGYSHVYEITENTEDKEYLIVEDFKG